MTAVDLEPPASPPPVIVGIRFQPRYVLVAITAGSLAPRPLAEEPGFTGPETEAEHHDPPKVHIHRRGRAPRTLPEPRIVEVLLETALELTAAGADHGRAEPGDQP